MPQEKRDLVSEEIMKFRLHMQQGYKPPEVRSRRVLVLLARSLNGFVLHG